MVDPTSKGRMTNKVLSIMACRIQEALSHSDHVFPVLLMVGTDASVA